MVALLPTTHRRILFVLAVAVAVSSLFVAAAAPARAHAVLVKTSPEFDQIVDSSPARIGATFNEPVEISFGALRVYDSAAERVDADDSDYVGSRESIAVTLEDGLPDGTYTATYRVISADAHAIEGAFIFHIGAPGARPAGVGEEVLGGAGGAGATEDWLYGVARWVNFTSLILLAGAAFFMVAVWRSAGGSVGSRPPEVETQFGRRWRMVALIAWWAALASTGATFALQGAIAADLPIGEALSMNVFNAMLDTRYGTVTVIKAGILVAVAGAWWLLARSAAGRAVPLGRRASSPSVGAASARTPVPMTLLVGLGVLMVGVLATPGLAGHAATTSPKAINVAVDTLHLAGVAAWMGGLVFLLTAAYPAIRSIDEDRAAAVLRPVVGWFSTIALGAVALIVVTGTIRAWFELESWSVLWSADYGRVLLTKIGVFIPLLALGAVNRRIIGRRVRTSIGASALARIRRTIAVEVAFGVVVIALTAWLVNLSPLEESSAKAATGPYQATLAFGEGELDLLIDPARVGQNLIHLTATNPDGSPLRLRSMAVDFTLPAADVGPIRSRAEKFGPGHFVVQGKQMSITGRWTLLIKGRVDKFTQLSVETPVVVNR